MRTVLGMILIVGIASIVISDDKGKGEGKGRPHISIEEIQNSAIIGDFGVPMGECVRFRAILKSANQYKGDEGYRLEVTHVKGFQLPKPIVCHFADAPQWQLVNDHFALRQLRKGTKARWLDSDQISKLEVGYVGQEVDFLGYQTGKFDGLPTKLPKTVPPVQGRGFYFSTELRIVERYQE